MFIIRIEVVQFENMDNTTTKSGSVFNMAVAYLTRIDKLLTQCAFYSCEGNIPAWQKSLRCLYKEVCIKLNDKEIEWIDGDSNQLANPRDKNFKVAFDNSTFKNINVLMNEKEFEKTKRKETLAMLDIIEQKIRIKMQEKDMLLPGKNDPRFSILER